MLPPGKPYTITPDQGRVVDLGPVRMRVLAAGEGTTDRAFILVEFTGGDGTWTVPHLHREMEESIFVLDGQFTVGVGDEEVRADPGAYILVPRATR